MSKNMSMKQSKDNRRRAKEVSTVIEQLRCWAVDREDCPLRAVRRDNTLVNLLANIRHYCDREGLEFHALERRAYQHYSEERQENPHV